MPWITKEGRTVEEARDAAIAESGMLTEELEIEVVNEGAKGLFGLGGEPAVVRVRPKGEAQDFRSAFQDDITPAPGDDDRPARQVVREERSPVPQDDRPRYAEDVDDVGEEEDPEEQRSLAERQEAATALGVEIIKGILERMDLEGEVRTRVAGGTVYIEVFGEEMGILIGRNGATLEALQELVRAGIQRRLKTRQAVVVDVEAYWDRRRKPEGREPRGGGGGGRDGGGRGGGRRGGRRRGGRGRPRGGSSSGGDPNRRGPEEPEPDGNR
jgi:spoIIIJ-associated protein